MPTPPSRQPQQPPPLPLNYADPGMGKMVLLARFASPEQAQLHAAELEAEGIPTQIFNANINALGPYVGLSDVELHVPETDRDRANALLREARSEDLEPDPAGGLAEPALDDDGQPVRVVALPGFQTVRQLRDAQTVLAAGRLNSYLPKLIPRGDRPAGVGKRFILSVAEADLERAQFLLEQAEADAEEDVPRCPQCSSWRVYPVMNWAQSLAVTLGFSIGKPREYECLVCHHRGPADDFSQGK